MNTSYSCLKSCWVKPHITVLQNNLCANRIQHEGMTGSHKLWLQVLLSWLKLATCCPLCGHSHLLVLKWSREWGKSRVFPKMGHKIMKTKIFRGCFQWLLHDWHARVILFLIILKLRHYKTQQANALLAQLIIFVREMNLIPSCSTTNQVYSSKTWWFSSTTASWIVEQILALRDVSQLSTFLQVCLLDISSYQGNPYLVNIYII